MKQHRHFDRHFVQSQTTFGRTETSEDVFCGQATTQRRNSTFAVLRSFSHLTRRLTLAWGRFFSVLGATKRPMKSFRKSSRKTTKLQLPTVQKWSYPSW